MFSFVKRQRFIKLQFDALERRDLLTTATTLVAHDIAVPELPNPRSVQAVDIDADGDLDVLAVSPSLSEMVLFENLDGQGSFGPQTTIAKSTTPFSETVPADFDADGDIDLVVYSNDRNGGSIGWFENADGQGHFGEYRELVAEILLDAVEVGDIDGDGVSDLVTLSSGIASLKVLGWRNDRNEMVSAIHEIATEDKGNGSSSRLFSLDLGDIDNDGDLDIVTGEGWYRNSGDGPWEMNELRFPEWLEVDRCQAIQLHDIDGDGDLDAVGSYYDYHGLKIAWFENTDGNGVFSEPQFVMDLHDSLFAIASATESGTDEIVAVGYDGVLRNQSGEIGPILMRSSSLASADLDGDGLEDLLFTSEVNHGVYWAKQSDAQVFQDPSSLNAPVWVIPANAEDVDGDGDVDIAGYDATYLNHNGSFQQRFGQFEATGNSHWGMRIDLDGDGDRDFVYSDRNETLEGLLRGSRLFVRWNVDGELGTDELVDQFAGAGESFRIVDVDSDGIEEIVWGSLLHRGDTDLTAHWYDFHDENGEQTFVKKLFEAELPVSRMDFGDINQDGLTDYVYLASNQAYWRRGLGHGEFAAPLLVYSGNAPVAEWDRPPWWFQQRMLFDMDGDGDLDVLLPTVQYVAWIPNSDGRGTFGDVRLGAVLGRGDSISSFNAVAVDMDSDGDLDLVLFSGNKGIRWFEQGESPTFDGPFFIDASRYIYLGYGDINGDGNLEIFTENEYFKNLGNHQFQIQSYGENTVSSFDLADMDLDGDVDLVTNEVTPTGIPILRWYQDRVIGDSNNDGVFDSADLVTVFQLGEYEDKVANNSSFSSGDWNQDGEFDSADLVFALQANSFDFFATEASPGAGVDLNLAAAVLADRNRMKMLTKWF
ncbi:MAG: VCBS repeat-containing protein [Planctomycetales bacterium]|nr:VCBS repeat-containing protein [Planctomycetales bacterium]